MLVTGFGAFRNITDNPSARLAEKIAQKHGLSTEVLPVTFASVEEFVSRLKGQPQERILCLGLSANSERLKFELYAHNAVGEEPDASGTKWGKEQIWSGGPKTLGQTLLSPYQLEKLTIRTSFTPRSYLCNFILYRLLAEFPERQVGFVHVPPFEARSERSQLDALSRLLGLVLDE